MELHTTFETEHASQYLQTLCKHFGRKIPVRFDATSGFIELPFGRCELSANQAHLDLSISAETQPDLDRAVQVISSHMERFAFRENPEFTWRSDANLQPDPHADSQSSSH